MNFLTYIQHLAITGITAYFSANQIRDPVTRSNALALFQLTEDASFPFLEGLSKRAAAEGNTWLAEKLAKHAADEFRHSRILTQALEELGKQVIDLKSLGVDQLINNPFSKAYYRGYSPEQLTPERIDWTVFMGSTYIVELDGSREFALMAKILPDNDPHSFRLKQRLLSIAKDELKHAAYMYEALERRYSAITVQTVITEWRTRKTNACVSTFFDLFQNGGIHGGIPSLTQDLRILKGYKQQSTIKSSLETRESRGTAY